MVSIFARTFIVYILLTLSMKIMGKREIGELDVGELVSTLLISEIAAIPIDDPDIPLLNAIIPISFIMSLEILLSYGKCRFHFLKKIMEGKPIYLIDKGRIDQKALISNRITLTELLSEIRSQGVESIADVEYAILEQNGRISIIKRGGSAYAHTVIVDGYLSSTIPEGYGKLKDTAYDEMKKRKIYKEDVFLLTVDDNNKINLIKKEKK
ncbi:MAG: DUF421 domain-containing protein [Clostridia bacterium]|nr:DUF421 domain-containing protein [Clostridia bacterium]